jgi:hypothetical protein
MSAKRRGSTWASHRAAIVYLSWVPTPLTLRKAVCLSVITLALKRTGVVVDPGMCARSLYGNREIGAADKAAILLVKGPAASVARVGCVAIPLPRAANQLGGAWCKRPGRRGDEAFRQVGAIQRFSERRSLNISECLHPRKGSLCGHCRQGLSGVAERVISKREVVSWEEASTRTGRTRRGQGPSTCVWMAEITSGRA